MYSILPDDDAWMLTIDSVTGELKLASSLNYESATSHTITVQAADMSGEAPATTIVTINVTDVAEAPVFPSTPYVFSVAEDAAYDTVIGTVTATDPQNDATYSILPGDDAWMFTIDSVTGELKLASSLNYESATSHTITVQAADMSGEAPATTTVTINVTDVAEDPSFNAPPAPETEWFFIVSEAAPNGHIVGSIPVTDPQPNTFITFDIYVGDITDQLTWTTSNEFYAEHEGGQAVIKTWGNLDFETKDEHTIIVVASDESGNQASIIVKIAIQNESEWEGTGIYLTHREVLLDNWHTAIIIVPSNQQLYENDDRFSSIAYIGNTAYRYATLSAFPSVLIPVPGGNLVSQVSAETVDFHTSLGLIETGGMLEDDLIALLFAMDQSYDDLLMYELFPEATPGTDYNSNSYVSGLMAALSSQCSCLTYPTPDSERHPGWNTPVPGDEFGI